MLLNINNKQENNMLKIKKNLPQFCSLLVIVIKRKTVIFLKRKYIKLRALMCYTAIAWFA